MELILEVPLFVAFLVIGIFRLDGLIPPAQRVPQYRRQHALCGGADDDSVIDPDGRPART